MILYVEYKNRETKVHTSKQSIKESITLETWIKRQFAKKLMCYDAYKKHIQKRLGKQYRIPLWIEEKQVYLVVSDIRKDTVLINQSAVEYYYAYDCDLMAFRFVNGEELFTKMTRKSFKNALDQINTIKMCFIKTFSFYE